LIYAGQHLRHISIAAPIVEAPATARFLLPRKSALCGGGST
jgi:hypothetical protein